MREDKEMQVSQVLASALIDTDSTINQNSEEKNHPVKTIEQDVEDIKSSLLIEVKAKDEKASLLSEKLKHLPGDPGVYLMKDKNSRVIYVGKARSLKQRVRSYFQAHRPLDPKTKALVSQIAELDFIVTDSEVEALILECNLIKHYRPKYNINLRDDKHYPYLKVTLEEDFPRVIIVRSVKKDGGRYFGPYTDVGAMKETLKFIQTLFPLRSCKQKQLKDRGRPCLNYHINRCWAPCSGQVKKEDYDRLVDQVVMFLEGKSEELIKNLTLQMKEAAESMNFERAAHLRDQIKSLQSIKEKQKIISTGLEDEDVIGLAQGARKAVGQVFFIRAGKIVGKKTFWLHNTAGEKQEKVLSEFLKQFYTAVDMIPPVIFLPVKVPEEEKKVIEKWLKQKRGSRRVKLLVPQRGEKRKLVEMVTKNATLTLEEKVGREKYQQEQKEHALKGLQKWLGLAHIPQRIEGYDISNFQGKASVGSMVVMENGEPLKSEYRRFAIKTVRGANDFASLQEVVRRRFQRGLEEQKEIREGKLEKEKARFARFPDLIIVDGGKGQLHAVREVMKEIGVSDIPTFGLAKEFEYLYAENLEEPLVLPSHLPELHLLQRLRDESHRFALQYHRKKRSKILFDSVFEHIPGIGEKRRKALLKYFGSIKQIQQAELEELLAVPGMNKKAAQAVQKYFSQKN